MTLLRRPILILAPFAVLVIVLALATSVLPLREILSQRQTIAAAEARLRELESGNAERERQVAALETPVEVERLARAELGYIRPGEKAYVVIDPAEAEATPSQPSESAADPGRMAMETAAAAAVGVDGAGFLERVWDFMTGRDLTGH